MVLLCDHRLRQVRMFRILGGPLWIIAFEKSNAMKPLGLQSHGRFFVGMAAGSQRDAATYDKRRPVARPPFG
jgi:hypothetical protein